MLLDKFKNKKIFITGNTGFKGTWLTHILLKAGADVCGYALQPPTNPSIFKLTETEKHIKQIYGDVADLEKLSSAMINFQPEIVLHLAAQPIVRESYKNPVYTYQTNVMGTVNFLEAVRKTPSIKSVVNITTDKVYLNREWAWGYRENEELCGFDPYSNSKSCSELVTYSYKNSFFNNQDSPAISTARSGNVIGGGDFAADRIIPDAIRYATQNKQIVVRNPYSTRPYQHVLECLSGYLILAIKQLENKTLEGNYNFGPDDDSCVTTGQLADLFCNAWKNISWVNISEQNAPHEANFLKLDCSKAKQMLGWKPNWDIKTAIEKIVEWHKHVINGGSPKEITEIQINQYFK